MFGVIVLPQNKTSPEQKKELYLAKIYFFTPREMEQLSAAGKSPSVMLTLVCVLHCCHGTVVLVLTFRSTNHPEHPVRYPSLE